MNHLLEDFGGKTDTIVTAKDLPMKAIAEFCDRRKLLESEK
jgi:hypothetical protein